MRRGRITFVCLMSASLVAGLSAQTDPGAQAVEETRKALGTLQAENAGFEVGNGEGFNAGSLSGIRLQSSKESSADRLPTNSGRPQSSEATLRDMQDKAWKERNWLIEGMRAAEQERGTDGRDAVNLEDNADRLVVSAADQADYWLQASMDQLAQEEQLNAAQSKLTDEQASPDAVNPVSNPLDAFMSDWVHASDLRLLSQGAITSNESPLNGVTLEPGGSANGSLTVRQPFNAAVVKQPNPFLDVMPAGLESSAGESAYARPEVPLSGLPVPQERARAATGPVAIVPFEPLQPERRQLSSVPENQGDSPSTGPWRPAEREDEKYFPRLKRF